MTRSILVVDDEPTMCKMLVLTLGEEGHSVDSELSGSSAIQRMREKAYDIVVTDANLKDMSGFDVARFSRTMASPPKVILITGMPKANADKSLFDAILLKPFRLPKLLTTIADLSKPAPL